MVARFVSIWFRHLVSDWLIRRQPDLKDMPFVLCQNERGRMTVSVTSAAAEQAGIQAGMALADARALEPRILTFDDKPSLPGRLLEALGDWCFRYTPVVSLDLPDGLMLDVTGCGHLFGGDHALLKTIVTRLREEGYDARAAMADTVGAAWGVARYGARGPLIAPGSQRDALAGLPPAALRLDAAADQRLKKLGIVKIASLFAIPRPTLARRFGPSLLLRLDQALGEVEEKLNPKRPVEPYTERLACQEGIATSEGIVAALTHLLERLCGRLADEEKGLRKATLYGYRLDGGVESIRIGTGSPTRRADHLLKLFSTKIEQIDPGLGIEVFILTAGEVLPLQPVQQDMAAGKAAGADVEEMVDRMANHLERQRPYRFMPQASHCPERSVRATTSLQDAPVVPWPTDKLRPVRMLQKPEPIEVTAPVPDYPPMLFRLRGVAHRVRKADGPERIEAEWWLEKGVSRDYYRLEDEGGHRYWVFRSGQFNMESPPRWFLHGYFA